MAMKRLASRTFSVCLLILFLMLAGTKGQQSQCTNGWFGDKCQYQCHCLNDTVCDKITGECPGGCDRRWFGPQCQYSDAAYNTKSFLTDGIKSTCLVGTPLSQDFPMLNDVMFTWMRIATNRPGLFDHMNMTFLSSTGIVTPKFPLTKIYLSDTILDVYGEFQERLNKISLGFDTPATRQSFCTMQVSSGRNVAIKQIASQSSTYGDGVAGRAVDGQSTQWYSEGSCTSTEGGDEASPYWKLDLSHPVTVNMYTILGRHYQPNECKPRYFQLETYFNSDTVHQYKNIDINYNIYTAFPLDTIAINSVKLTVSKEFNKDNCGGHPAVSFCEMQIYGDCEPGKWGRECEKNCNCQDPCFALTGRCPSQCKAGFLGPECQTECDAGYYGDNCNQPCPPNCLNNICNNVDGKCTQCVAGYRGLRCEKVCDAGYYGDNCNRQCPTNCLNNICNNVDGKCTQCVAGYQGHWCEQVCDAGYYGENCNQPCPTKCLNNICNNVDGRCTQCVAGYQGPRCEQECSDGQWGLKCQNVCGNCLTGTCNKGSGECLSGCVQGYKPPHCEKECDAGYYGDNCNQVCPTNCLNNNCNNVDGKCTQCLAGYQGPRCELECDPGFYGDNCNQTCPENCLNKTCNNVNGTCNECVAGYQGPRCAQECDDGFHGYNCNQTCPENCLNNTCNNVNGTCINCMPGYQGPECNEECLPGSFGLRCAHNCSEHCGRDGFCNNINGSCLSGCEPGYSSDNCERPCAYGTYGESCSKTCNVNCMMNATQEPAICEHVNGHCLLGCLSGYSGITCEEIPSDSGVNLVIIVIPIILVLFAAAALIFGVWFWRRRKVKKTEHEGTVHSPIDEANVEPQNEYADTSPYEMAREIREDEVNLYINTQEMQVRFSKTAIPVESLGEYLASHDMDFFIEQFQLLDNVRLNLLSLQKVPECRATTKAAESSVNMHKNRYKNILAYDHSRVRLQENTKKKQGDYYNANFIQGIDGTKYIASQAPNKGVLADFIRMIWEQEVELVVMLTKLAEEGKAKCECYWPINDSTEVTFGEITVKLAATRVLADYTKRTLQLIKNDGQSRFVTHYHFTSWPDKGVPQTPWALVDFEQVVDYHYDTEKPLLVHCSAGVGRTGTFIALRNVLKEAKISGYIDFYQTLAKMRQDRIFMIQTVEQYRFLHDAAQVALLCQDALMTSEALNVRLGVLMTVTETGETNMEKEFKMVCALVGKENNNNSEKETTEYVNSVEIDQNFMTNIKNRFSNILAKKEHRPKLAFDHENEYINAVFVPSMTKQEQQLLTQLPLPNTVVDFWRLVSQYSVSLIVAFDSDQQNPKKPVGDYLPKHNKPLDCGKFDISEDKATLGAFWEKQKIHVQAKSEVTNSFYVQHIKCTKSKLDAKDWLLLIKELHSLAPIGDTRTLYMCMNGADQSGFACILSLLINRVEHDHFLTVPLVVGEIKSIRPEVIPNKDQYCSLYTILQRHCELAHVYTNHTPHAIRKVQNSLKLHPKPEHVYSEIDKSEEVSQHQKMPPRSKAPAKKTVSDDKPESKKRTESSKSRPVSSSEQALSKQSLEPQNGPGDNLFDSKNN